MVSPVSPAFPASTLRRIAPRGRIGHAADSARPERLTLTAAARDTRSQLKVHADEVGDHAGEAGGGDRPAESRRGGRAMNVCGLCASAPATDPPGRPRGSKPCWDAVVRASEFLKELERLRGPDASRTTQRKRKAVSDGGHDRRPRGAGLGQAVGRVSASRRRTTAALSSTERVIRKVQLIVADMAPQWWDAHSTGKCRVCGEPVTGSSSTEHRSAVSLMGRCAGSSTNSSGSAAGGRLMPLPPMGRPDEGRDHV